MMEKAKTAILALLVLLSLIQTYMLAYSMPGFVATVGSVRNYVNTETVGKTTSVESVIFPEALVLHMGDNQHTLIYPDTQFYEMILQQRIQGREFKGFQKSASNTLNWAQIREKEIGVELLFDKGIPVSLLSKVMKLEMDFDFMNETIDRIMIFKTAETEEVRTFFFSKDGVSVYESTRADLTVRDVQDYVGFGQFQPRYELTKDGLYLPMESIEAMDLKYDFSTYSPDLMQRNLFFDPGTTRALNDRSGAQIYTDGKRGLQIMQKGTWVHFTDPAALQSGANLLNDNVYASVDFINQHGGWDGLHRFVSPAEETRSTVVRFQQYIDQFPVVGNVAVTYGMMQLRLQQGVVTEYMRTLITLDPVAKQRNIRWLPGGDRLRERLQEYERRREVSWVFPALRVNGLEERTMNFEPVWAVRLKDGSEEVLLGAHSPGYEPPQAERTQGSPVHEVTGTPDHDEGGLPNESEAEPVDASNVSGDNEQQIEAVDNEDFQQAEVGSDGLE